jgi:PAS domain S-box-containing protein
MERVVATIAALFFCLLAPGVRALDSSTPLGKFGHRSWSSGDGLGTSMTRSITQDAQGYIWIGVTTGVIRFDGQRMERFDVANTPLLDSQVRRVFADRQGAVWIGTGNRLIRYLDGRFEEMRSGAYMGGVCGYAAITQARDDAIWAAGTCGVIDRFADGKWTRPISERSLPRNAYLALAADPVHGVWIASGKGLVDLTGETPRVIREAVGQSLAYMYGITVDRHGDVWMATERGLFRKHGESFTFLGGRHPLLSKAVTSVVEDSAGTIWAGTMAGGVVRIRDDSVAAAENSNLTDSAIADVFEDREGNLWLATQYGGVNQFRDIAFVTYGRGDGIRKPVTNRLYPRREGGVWGAMTQSGLARIDAAGKLTMFGVADGLPSNEVISVTEQENGDVWVGFRHQGIARWRDGQIDLFTTKNGLSSDYVETFLPDSDGSLWIGPLNGELQRWSSTRGFETFPAPRSPNGRGVTFMARHPRGGWWMVNGDGVQQFRDGRWTLDQELKGVDVNELFTDASGVTWIASADRGLGIMQNGRTTWLDHRAGLCRSVQTLVEDERGDLWLACKPKVYRVSKNALKASALTHQPLEPLIYDLRDGLPNDEVISMTRSIDGRIWFGTLDGIAMFDPRKTDQNAAAFPVIVESIALDGKTARRDRLRFSSATRRVVFSFVSPTFATPERLRYRYKLVDFDSEWMESRQGSAVYTNLRPGAYSFLVQASVDGKHWSSANGRTQIEVLPTLFETGWFRIVIGAVALIILCLAILLLVRHRTAVLRHRERELVALVDERTTLLIEAKDAAVSSANAHAELSRRNGLILESAAEGIFGIDPDGRTTFINRAGAAMLGWDADELIGRELHPLVHPSDSEIICPICSEEKKGIATRASAFITRRGESIFVDFTAGEMHADANDHTGTVITFRDISQRVAVERMKDEFMATVSHELRTPLTSMRGALGLLSNTALGPATPKGQRMVEVALANAERLMRLVNDILDSERLTSGSIELRKTSFNAADLMEQVADVMGPMAERTGVRLTLDPVQAEICADSDRLTQTLTNLVSNAIKFSPAGSVIRLWAEIDPRNVIFHVTDRGRGIPADKLQLVFERFKQVELADANDKGGSGLGLAICRGIAEAHGGTISVTSVVGEGSTFSVTLPVLVRELGFATVS